MIVIADGEPSYHGPLKAGDFIVFDERDNAFLAHRSGAALKWSNGDDRMIVRLQGSDHLQVVRMLADAVGLSAKPHPSSHGVRRYELVERHV